MQQYLMTWKEIQEAAEQLAFDIKSKHTIEHVVAIARGGLIPAMLINQFLNVRRINSFGIEFYDKSKVQRVPKVYQEITEWFDNEKVLIIDDIADSGTSMNIAIEEVIRRGCNKNNIVTCTLHYKPRSINKPDFFYKTIDNDTWVAYPYEYTEITAREL